METASGQATQITETWSGLRVTPVVIFDVNFRGTQANLLGLYFTFKGTWPVVKATFLKIFSGIWVRMLGAHKLTMEPEVSLGPGLSGLLLTSYMTLDNSHNFSEPQFFSKMGQNRGPVHRFYTHIRKR